jgi:hypothetical protein
MRSKKCTKIEVKEDRWSQRSKSCGFAANSISSYRHCAAAMLEKCFPRVWKNTEQIEASIAKICDTTK